MTTLGTTITSIAISGALLTAIAVTPVAAQPVPAGQSTGVGSTVRAGAVTAQVPYDRSDAARTALLRTLPTLRQGSEGGEVLALQIGLIAGGAHLAADGAFGPVTAGAVRAFQRSHRLAVDGIVGPHTWNALVAKAPGFHFRLQNPQLSPGQLWSEAAGTGGSVRYTLELLHEYAPWAPAQAPGADRSRYDGAQVATVRELQRRSGITSTGIIGARTTRVILLIGAVIAPYGS